MPYDPKTPVSNAMEPVRGYLGDLTNIGNSAIAKTLGELLSRLSGGAQAPQQEPEFINDPQTNQPVPNPRFRQPQGSGLLKFLGM